MAFRTVRAIKTVLDPLWINDMAAVSADEEDVLAVADSDIWHGVVARVTVGLDVECHWKVCKIYVTDRRLSPMPTLEVGMPKMMRIA